CARLQGGTYAEGAMDYW
nr:immunoglobulin heavy chain junction region [Mus musculus]